LFVHSSYSPSVESVSSKSISLVVAAVRVSPYSGFETPLTIHVNSVAVVYVSPAVTASSETVLD